MSRPVPKPREITPELLAQATAIESPGYTFHPAANLFPLLDEESDEFKLLVEDIKANGLTEPIKLLGRQIIDGRNRYRACLAADVEPVYLPTNPQDPIAYVISLNLRRRHLSREQRAEVVRKLRDQGRSIRDIAEAMAVPKSTVARDLEEKSPVPNGTPGVVNALTTQSPTGDPGRLTDEEALELEELESTIGRGAPRVKGRDGKSYAAAKPKTVVSAVPTQTEQDAEFQKAAVQLWTRIDWILTEIEPTEFAKAIKAAGDDPRAKKIRVATIQLAAWSIAFGEAVTAEDDE